MHPVYSFYILKVFQTFKEILETRLKKKKGRRRDKNSTYVVSF